MTATATLTGQNFIGYDQIAGQGTHFQAIAPALNAVLPEPFVNVTAGQANDAVERAAQAFIPYGKLSAEQRAAFLDAIADEIDILGDVIVERANAESGLPLPRLMGERGRTTGQLRLFAQVVREGSWVDARINVALPDRKPLARPDIRRMLVPLGPVVVFGASNFPLAFSVAGGDTASALAAGCPVVVKAHPSHPGTSELVGRAIVKAAQKTGMPDGVFSLVHADITVAQQLVAHPAIKAVGFTGSRAGGLALVKVAQSRPEPIPVYAEMSAVNPIVILPGALTQNAVSIAEGLAASVTLGVGQFCTSPGLVFMLESDNQTAFLKTLVDKIRQASPATMLTGGILTAYERGLADVQHTGEVTLLAQANQSGRAERTEARPTVLGTTGQAFQANPRLSEEIFGPITLLVSCKNENELVTCLQKLEGQLTATLYATSADLNNPSINGAPIDYVALLQAKAGRVLFGGFPTGVEVCEAMTHGGPYPATSDSRTTSVGTGAILRFVRPVSYQSFPNALLPAELQDGNPRGIWRLLESDWTKASV